jgi:hypothetical protein
MELAGSRKGAKKRKTKEGKEASTPSVFLFFAPWREPSSII